MPIEAPVEPLSGTMDVNEFMAWLETRPKQERWQLVEGVAVMMNSPTLAHHRIADNLQALLNQCFAAHESEFHAYQEIAIRCAGVGNFQPEPDVAVVPGVSGYGLFSEDFRLIAEVLSPSNTRREIGAKLRRYRQSRDNLYVLVIDSRRIWVEAHARSRGWQSSVLSEYDNPIELAEFSFRCLVGDLYRGTPLDPVRAA